MTDGLQRYAALHSLIESANVPACSRIGAIWPVFSAYLKAVCGTLCLDEHVLQHRTLEQRRVAERRRGENHAFGAAGLDLLQQEDALVLALRVVLRRGRCRAVQERLRELLERIAVRGHVVEQPARHQHEVVVDDVAAGHLDRLDQPERRLLAERAVQHDARVVALRPRQRVGRREVVADELRVLLRRQHHAGAQHQVDLGGGRLPRLRGAVSVEVLHCAAVLVVDADRRVELVVGDRRAAQLAEIVAQDLELMDVEACRRSRPRSSAARRSSARTCP